MLVEILYTIGSSKETLALFALLVWAIIVAFAMLIMSSYTLK